MDKSYLFKLSASFLLMLFVALGIRMVLAWTSPTASPPAENVVMPWLTSGNDIYNGNSGNVGIGTTTPQTLLDVNGAIKIGSTSVVCSASIEGAIRYNFTNKNLEYCDGTNWTPFGAGGGGGSKANGELCSAGSECASGFCYVDEDGDRYAPSAGSMKCQPNSQLAGTDCYDSNANAYPGQTNYFTVHRGDGSFDYDCNGTEERQYAKSCFMTGSPGWVSYTPACGVTSNYDANGAPHDGFLSYYACSTTNSLTQACR